mgnify:CR=1 FL=1
MQFVLYGDLRRCPCQIQDRNRRDLVLASFCFCDSFTFCLSSGCCCSFVESSHADLVVLQATQILTTVGLLLILPLNFYFFSKQFPDHSKSRNQTPQNALLNGKTSNHIPESRKCCGSELLLNWREGEKILKIKKLTCMAVTRTKVCEPGKTLNP